MGGEYTFRQPNGEPGLYEEFHTGRAIIYSNSLESKTSMLAFVNTDVPLFARILSDYEKLPIEIQGDMDCLDVYFGPVELPTPDLKETLKERAHMQRNLQQCDAGPCSGKQIAYLSIGDAIQQYANAYQTQCEMHSQRTFKDIHPKDFRAYFRAFILKPLNYSSTRKGKIGLLSDFERFMEDYLVQDHLKTFCETAYKNPKAPLLAYFSRIFEDMKKENYTSISDRLKKISSRLQSV